MSNAMSDEIRYIVEEFSDSDDRYIELYGLNSEAYERLLQLGIPETLSVGERHKYLTETIGAVAANYSENDVVQVPCAQIEAIANPGRAEMICLIFDGQGKCTFHYRSDGTLRSIEAHDSEGGQHDVSDKVPAEIEFKANGKDVSEAASYTHGQQQLTNLGMPSTRQEITHHVQERFPGMHAAPSMAEPKDHIPAHLLLRADDFVRSSLAPSPAGM